MSKLDIEANIRYLIDTLNQWTAAYDEGHPEVSDKEWDDAYFKLVYLENNTGVYYPDSPTQKIDYRVVNQLNKVEHSHPMLSLDKTKSIDEVNSFINKQEVLVMTKCDGLTCSITYKNGKLVSAETRGNGLIGEDITHNALAITGIPNRINYKDELVIDGEIVCLNNDFKNFTEDYKNPRNFAAGSIRLLDSKECAARRLTFIVWEVIKGFDDIKYLSFKLKKCFDLGFRIVPFMTINQPLNSKTVDIILSMSDNVPYDGLVIKYNNIEYGKSLGSTAHHFKNAIAYKLYDEEYESKLISIEWQVGRTGQIVPIAVFEPIDIEGSIVQRASLHNMSVLTDILGSPYKGQTIWITKRNMIIPQIEHADKREILPTEALAFPTTCPICGANITVNSNNNILTAWCSNPDCEGKFINRLEHFCGKKGLDIRGLSKATLSKLIDEFWITNFKDIFNLQEYRTEWVKMPGFGPKSVDNILAAIEKSKTCALDKFICSLGIPLIGQTASKQLSEFFKSYDAFRKAVDDNFNFAKLADFGDITNIKIHQFDFTEADELYNDILTIVNPEEKDESQKELDGLVFAATGSATPFANRTALKDFIEAHGGKLVSSISKNVNYLVNNDINATSSKNIAAKKLNIPIITGQDLITLSIDKT